MLIPSHHHMLTVSTRLSLRMCVGGGLSAFIHPKPKLWSLRLVPWCVYIVSSNLLGYPSSLIEKYTPLVETWSQLVNRFDFCKLPSAVRQSKRVLRLLCGDDSLRGSFGEVVKRGHKLMVEKIGRGHHWSCSHTHIAFTISKRGQLNVF